MGALLLVIKHYAVSLALKTIGTELTKTVIAYGLNKLLAAKGDGITKDIALTVIDAVAKSKRNPTTEDMFKEAVAILEPDQ